MLAGLVTSSAGQSFFHALQLVQLAHIQPVLLAYGVGADPAAFFALTLDDVREANEFALPYILQHLRLYQIHPCIGQEMELWLLPHGGDGFVLGLDHAVGDGDMLLGADHGNSAARFPVQLQYLFIVR